MQRKNKQTKKNYVQIFLKLLADSVLTLRARPKQKLAVRGLRAKDSI